MTDEETKPTDAEMYQQAANELGAALNLLLAPHHPALVLEVSARYVLTTLHHHIEAGGDEIFIDAMLSSLTDIKALARNAAAE